jgi:hypothetical protein
VPAKANRVPRSCGAVFNKYLANGWDEQAIDKFQECGFSAATATQQNKCFARLNGK